MLMLKKSENSDHIIKLNDYIIKLNDNSYYNFNENK